MRIIMNEFDKVFLPYWKILDKFKALNIKTKNGKEITHKDLRKAIDIMVKKHPTCRWKSEKVRSKRYYILFEGYLWLRYVYFQSEKKHIDADIDFFKTRIKLYEEFLKVEPKALWIEDMCFLDLENYFHRKKDTIYRAMMGMSLANAGNTFTYCYNDKLYVSKEGIEWLCKNCFKQKYLELLEEYKMELTEKYIEAGYAYDNYFGIN